MSREAVRQAGGRADSQVCRQAIRQTGIQISRYMYVGMYIVTYAGSLRLNIYFFNYLSISRYKTILIDESSVKAGRLTDRQAGKQAGRQANRLAGGCVGGLSGKKAGRYCR